MKRLPHGPLNKPCLKDYDKIKPNRKKQSITNDGERPHINPIFLCGYVGHDFFRRCNNNDMMHFIAPWAHWRQHDRQKKKKRNTPNNDTITFPAEMRPRAPYQVVVLHAWRLALTTAAWVMSSMFAIEEQTTMTTTTSKGASEYEGSGESSCQSGDRLQKVDIESIQLWDIVCRASSYVIEDELSWKQQ